MEGLIILSCKRQCDWDENDVCRSCGMDYSVPEPETSSDNEINAEKDGLIQRLRCSGLYYASCSLGRWCWLETSTLDRNYPKTSLANVR